MDNVESPVIAFTLNAALLKADLYDLSWLCSEVTVVAGEWQDQETSADVEPRVTAQVVLEAEASRVRLRNVLEFPPAGHGRAAHRL